MATCSNRSRLLRGGTGAVIGGTAGGLLWTLPYMLTPTTLGQLLTSKSGKVIAVSLGLLGAVAGAFIGARKPEC